jgi:FkbM family methyltransferase
LFPNRTVRRHVQGVDLYLPWSHPLPDYAWSRDYYGQNLIELAAALAARHNGSFNVLDVGANVGDSALQLLLRVDAKVLSVEGDPYWVRYLRMNTDADPRITVVEGLLTTEDEAAAGVRPVRGSGTTSFEPGSSGDDGPASVSVTSLRSNYPEFADVRLIKSDTDGFDTVLVPALAGAWRDVSPVLHFEFDPELTSKATGADPNAVWEGLEELGYTELLVWDNAGDPLGRLHTGAARKAAASLENAREFGYDFWDVAACRPDDSAALEAFDELSSAEFDPRGVGGGS